MLFRSSRIMWRIAYAASAKLLPQSTYSKFSRRMRGFFARRICASVGEDVNIERGATFGSLIVIGDRSGIGVDCELHGEIYIGNDVMMAPECVFYTSNHETGRIDIPMNQQGRTLPKPITIGNDVWIGRRVMIMPGVNVGDGCILAAGTVVTKNLPPYSIAGGVPAKVLGTRIEQ